jgi:glycosyltransferase involved in cell wall biosynthesis
MPRLKYPIRDSTVTFVAPASPPFSASAYDGRGVGGNEATVVCWARELATRGFQVSVYTTLDTQGAHSDLMNITWHPLEEYASNRASGILIAIRSVNPLFSSGAQSADFKILFIGDRVTPNVSFLEPGVCDAVWVNSEFHYSLYSDIIPKSIPTFVGCCGWDPFYFRQLNTSARVPGRCIHMSAPYRGLNHLLRWWPRVRSILPWAELHVAGGYELWGYSSSDAINLLRRDISQETLRQLAKHGVIIHGSLERRKYVELVISAELHLYPTEYDETCCIAALEAEAAGLVQILSAQGALVERINDGQTGVLIYPPASSPESDNAFVETTVGYLSTSNGRKLLRSHSELARMRSIDTSTPKVIDKLEALISGQCTNEAPHRV